MSGRQERVARIQAAELVVCSENDVNQTKELEKRALTAEAEDYVVIDDFLHVERQACTVHVSFGRNEWKERNCCAFIWLYATLEADGCCFVRSLHRKALRRTADGSR